MPYSDRAWAYREAGWKGVLPLPPQAKWPPPEGYTGASNPDPTEEDIQTWVEEHDEGNLALRLPPDVIGIDVDCYGEKDGAETLAGLEDELGPLPDAPISTSRSDGVSGIRLFRVPPHPSWSDPGPGVEVIHHGWRYVVAWPSVHPEGGLYTWSTSAVPAKDDLPMLPEAWVAYLSSDQAAPAKADVTNDEVAEWLSMLPAEDDMCAAVENYLDNFLWALETGQVARHDAMLMATSRLLRAADQGHTGVYPALVEAKKAFIDVVTSPGHGQRTERQADSEWKRGVAGAYGIVRSDPTPPDQQRCNCLTALEPTLGDEFWQARGYLGTIKQAAHSRSRSAMATLGAVLARVIANTLHEHRLPPIVGSPAGLSLLVTLVGPPGTGKSTAVGISGELLPQNTYVKEIPMGSGEGIVDAMFEMELETGDDGNKRKVKKQKYKNVFLYVDEGEVLATIGNRSGSTLLPTLRSIFSGQTLGQANASMETRRIVEGDQYVYGVVFGIQPAKAGEVLDDVDAGTPQRLLWLPAVDPTIPDDQPEWPGELPNTQGPTTVNTVNGYIEVHQDIRDEIVAEDLARQRGVIETDPLDAHSNLLKLKVATALAFLDNRAEVRPDDWRLAEHVMVVNRATRDYVVEKVRRAQERQEEQTAERLGRREAIKEKHRTKERSEMVVEGAEWVYEKVREAEGEYTWGRLRTHTSKFNEKTLWEDIATYVEGAGWVEERELPADRGNVKKRLYCGEEGPS